MIHISKGFFFLNKENDTVSFQKAELNIDVQKNEKVKLGDRMKCDSPSFRGG